MLTRISQIFTDDCEWNYYTEVFRGFSRRFTENLFRHEFH